MKTVHTLLIPTLFFSYLNSATLKDIVLHTIENNPKIKAIENNTKANKYYIDESFGDYLPTLNYEAYIQDKKIIDTPLGGNSATRDENGSYQQLKLEQNLYNGGLTKAKVEEAKHNHQANLIANIHDTEKLILDTVLAYLDLLKYEELKRLTENDLEIHSIYLETAVETEQVSGDIVDRLLVESKILTAKEKLIQIREDRKKAKTQLEKNIVKNIDDIVCRPKIDYNQIPSELNELLTYGIKNNYNVLEEIERIKSQKSVVSQELSRFLPSIDFQLTKEIDDGIDNENLKQNNQSARISLNYNFFNGFKDEAVYLREKKFLEEAQKNLDDVTNSSKQKIEENFYSFNLSKEKLEVLRAHVLNNKEILKVFGEQFDGGTRSFIDVLNQEEELYRKKSDLIEEEYKNFVSYFTLLFEVSNLSDTILNNKENICQEIDVDYRVIEKKPEAISQELENLLSEDNLLEDTNSNIINEEENKDKIKEKVNRVFNSLLKDIYETEDIQNIRINDINEKKLEEKKEEKVLEELENSIPIENSDELLIEKESKTKDVKNFTIVLGTVLNQTKSLDEILKRYKKIDDVFAYEYKANGKSYATILCGSFETLQEARNRLATLDSKILKNKPFISNAKKHQRLYDEYNSLLGEKN